MLDLTKLLISIKTILEACREVLYISEPKGIWEVYDYDAKNGIVLADKPFKLEGKSN